MSSQNHIPLLSSGIFSLYSRRTCFSLWIKVNMRNFRIKGRVYKELITLCALLKTYWYAKPRISISLERNHLKEYKTMISKLLHLKQFTKDIFY